MNKPNEKLNLYRIEKRNLIRMINFMKRNCLPIIFAILVFVSCSPQKSTKQVITVSIPPQKYFVEQIVGDAFPVNVMLPPGASPADYEPSTRQLQELNNSIIYFYIGHLGFEKSWMKKFSETVSTIDYVSCSKGIDLLRGDVHSSDGGHENHRHGTDPHIWTSPENVKTISNTICASLSAKFPEKATEFEHNKNVFIAKIDTLDNYIRTNFADSTRNSFMIFHPSMGYYARDYNLEQLPIEFEGKSPSPAHMKHMVDLAREKKISTIFIQAQFETDKATAVAREIGAEVVSIDPLSEDWLNEMYSMTDKFESALSK